MTTAQPDKTGLHILLKLAALVVILAGIHAAADIIVQLLLALFFAIVLNPLVTWFIRRGVGRPIAITLIATRALYIRTKAVFDVKLRPLLPSSAGAPGDLPGGTPGQCHWVMPSTCGLVCGKPRA